MIIKAALRVYSSLPAIYSLVPSIGSISQNVFRLFFFLRSTVSSEMIGMLGVKILILSVSILLTSRSPFVTGELSGFVIIFSSVQLSSDLCYSEIPDVTYSSFVPCEMEIRL